MKRTLILSVVFAISSILTTLFLGCTKESPQEDLHCATKRWDVPTLAFPLRDPVQEAQIAQYEKRLLEDHELFNSLCRKAEFDPPSMKAFPGAHWKRIQGTDMDDTCCLELEVDTSDGCSMYVSTCYSANHLAQMYALTADADHPIGP